MKTPNKPFKVIIIGAGVSGLTAANFLYKNGVKEILILEAKDKVGGRIHTVTLADGKIELGAQWIHGEESDFCQLVKDSGHRHYTTSWEGRGDFLLPSGDKADTVVVKAVLDWVERKIEFVEDNYSIETLQDGKMGEFESMGTFLRNEFVKYLNSQNLLEGSEEYEVQMATFQWAMSFQRIDNSCNQMSDLSLYRWSEFDVCRGEHYNNFLEGASSFINNVLGASLPKEIIKLNCPVANISWGSNNSDNIEVVTEDNKSFFAHCVLVTCSIGVLKANQETLFSPELPPVLREALNSSGFGPIGKILLKWDEPWWPAGTEGFQFLWPKDYINCCDDQRHLSEDDLIRNWPKSITGFDPVLDSPKWLLGWLGGPEAKFVETISEKEVGEKCAKLLEDFTGYKVSLPDEVYVSKWNNDRYFRGAYSFRSKESDAIPGDICSVLSEPVMKIDKDGNERPVIFLAGEALSRTHYSTLHGAYESGEGQAAKILKYMLERQQKQILKEESSITLIPNELPKCVDGIPSSSDLSSRVALNVES